MRDPGAVSKRWGAVVVIIALGAMVSACGQGDDGESGVSTTSDPTLEDPAESTPLPEAVQELVIDADEYSFEFTPDVTGELRPGWTLVEFHNIGAEAHQVMFARLKDDVDMDELVTAGANDSSGAGAIEFVDMIGGVSYIGPGQETTALVNLTEGTVMAMCYVPDGNGVAHALHGMTKIITVGAPSEDDEPTETVPGGEEVLGTIELAEDGYRLPEEMATGWYHVENTDSALHELSLLRLGAPLDEHETGLLVEDLAANRTPDVELEAVGGMGAISAGFDGYLYLDLADGDYLAVDFMPDPGEPRPHMLDGYFGGFTV